MCILCISVIKVYLGGQSVSRWSKCISVVKVYLGGQSVSRWSKCISVVKVYLGGQSVSRWSKCILFVIVDFFKLFNAITQRRSFPPLRIDPLPGPVPDPEPGAFQER